MPENILKKFHQIEDENKCIKQNWLSKRKSLYQSRTNKQDQYQPKTQFRKQYDKAFAKVTLQSYEPANEAVSKMKWPEKQRLIEEEMAKEKDAEKERKKAEKEAEKERKKAEKEAEKERKKAERKQKRLEKNLQKIAEKNMVTLAEL